MKFVYLSLLMASTLPFITHAQSLPVNPDARLSLGLNVAYGKNAYQADDILVVSPHGFYDNNRWYIEGGEAGFYPYKDNKHHARIGLAYDGPSFNPKNSKGTLQGLDKRKASAQALISYMYVSPIGGFKAKVATDALSHHDGTVITLSHISRFEHDKFTIYPTVGVNWYDKNYNSYYYGVSSAESNRTGIDAYQPNSGFAPFASAMINYEMKDNITLFANQRIEWLASAQKNSPMTDDKITSTTRLGVSYRF
ncbi:MipA/OmpV family protein [Moraxella sp. ZY200743]|uniref:MipA/OmpV family protein n=1 Tax=Moraxella sp. ZY200743 TaxID=2911970 RepID=UPI003D7F11FD